jgi:hypothetical protein
MNELTQILLNANLAMFLFVQVWVGAYLIRKVLDQMFGK